LSRLSYPWLLALTLGLTETVSCGVLFYAFSVFVEPMEAELGWTRAELAGAFSVALIVLVTWWRTPLVRLQGRMEPSVFDAEGSVVIGYEGEKALIKRWEKTYKTTIFTSGTTTLDALRQSEPTEHSA